ncbi:9793_t:CDS:2 [Entrophospora sp. SA101]|nr:9793_t:CDS:2 [Entrophospora sp. SA101]
MQFFQFIFLKRNWAVDKGPLTKQMTRFARSNDPLWLLIFPEGTIVSEETRVTSKKFADKTGLVDHKYVLLPRSTGLHFCKSALGKSIDYLYDLTIGLEIFFAPSTLVEQLEALFRQQQRLSEDYPEN